VFFAVCCLCPAGPAASQGITPSPELLQIFQSLPPEQQQAILKQLGISGGAEGLGMGEQGAGGEERGAGMTRQGTLGREAAPLTRQPRLPSEEEAEFIPGLKPFDWVIVEIDFQLPARPLALTLQAMNLPQTVAPGTATTAPTAMPSAIPPNAQNAALANLLAANPNAVSGAAAAPSPATAQGTQFTDEERMRLQGVMDLIRAKNPYQLTGDGLLLLPGFRGIPLLGLTDEQATLRLKVEPGLRSVDVRLTRLPLRKSGAEALKPFGYDLFDRAPSTFAPVTNVPVPSDYVLGPGDELDVQLYGNQNRRLKLVVARDGQISLPELGPINVVGQRFTSVKATIEGMVERQMVGIHASVSMGDTRAIRVFVLGEAREPGTYTVSALGSITSALYAAGGVKRIGSLRRIQLKRQGALVRQLDLYDVLIRGDTTDDVKLLQGDVILVPPVGSTVGVDGEVRRPAIYEIKGESTIADLVRLADGLTPEADTSKAMLTRIDESGRRIVLPVDLAAPGITGALRNGDLLRVARLRPTLDSGIVVQGHVYVPGAFAYRPGIRLSQIIHSVDELRPSADLHYILIRREMTPNRQIAVVSADLAAALNAPGTPADLELMPRDRITVFDLESGRDRVIQPILDELRMQGSAEHPSQVVHVDGRVKVPGEYPLEPGMRVSDLIRAGGGTTDAAYDGRAELIRYQVVNGESRRTDLLTVDLTGAMSGDGSANLLLRPFDTLSVRELPDWERQESVTLKGEVRFPGTYAIRRGETLESVITRAGGLTAFAFPEGSVFTREELKRREQQLLDDLSDRTQRELAVFAVQAAAGNQSGAANALSVGQNLLGQLKGAKAVGRLVIDLPRLVHAGPGSTYDVVLRDGDTLAVPRAQQQVSVIGEVQSATSHLYNPKLTRDDYIALSGGVTHVADKGRIYVVRANGSVVSAESGGWFRRNSDVTIKTGDTIVVPVDAEHIPALPFWAQATQILYNIAIAVLAVRSL
jgi:protein involved in polysaccharide export with SLBB domain